MIKHGEISRTEARDVLKELTGSQLDPSVLQMGFEVTPEVYTVGSAIGHLRSKGYLMTEIDVKLLSQKVEKEEPSSGKPRSAISSVHRRRMPGCLRARHGNYLQHCIVVLRPFAQKSTVD